MNNLLITGATGFMGRATVQALLDEFPDAQVYAVVRPPKSGNPADRPELAAVAGHPRLHFLAGDVVQPCLGLSGELPEHIDTCIHLAASTEFKESLRAETFRINVDGTRHLLELLTTRYPRAKFYHVSTAYVCGYNSDVSTEALFLAPEQGFLNPYEESKHAAEQLVAASALDWTILRPSIIVGHSETGWAESDKMVYGYLKSYKRFRDMLSNKYSEGEIATLADKPFCTKGDLSVPKNVLCIDDALRLLSDIMHAKPPSGSIYHLTNPISSTCDIIHNAFCDALDIRCLNFRTNMPDELRIEEKILERGTEIYRPYLLTKEPYFDQTQLRALLGDKRVDGVRRGEPSLLRFLGKAYIEANFEVNEPTATIPLTRRRELLRRYGGGTLGYSTLENTLALPLPGKRGYVSYAVKDITATMVGDPVCRSEDLLLAVSTFLDFCSREGRTPTAMQVGQSVADELAARGGHANRIGFDGWLDLASFDFELKGIRFADLRSFRNLGQRNGIVVREATYREIPHAHVEEVSQSWLRGKVNTRELGLLLRPLPPTDEPDVRKFFAFIGEELVGLVLFEPIYADGRIIGYYSNHERYLNKPGGIHDAILLTAMERFRDEGCPGFSLGLAPLHGLELGDHSSHCPMTKAIFMSLYKETAAVYNFRGVSHHKKLFCPRWEPLHFWTTKNNAADQILDIFAMIGLIPPEAVWALSRETLDLLGLD